MTPQQITINGKPVSIIFNMSTVLAFEEKTGKSFFAEDFSRFKERLLIIHAAIQAADNKPSVSFDDLMSISDWDEMSSAYTAVMNQAKEFFHIPLLVSESEKKESDGQTEEEQPKNV